MTHLMILKHTVRQSTGNYPLHLSNYKYTYVDKYVYHCSTVAAKFNSDKFSSLFGYRMLICLTTNTINKD